MSARRVDGDAAAAHLAQRQRVVRVAAHEGGQVERGRQPVAAVGQQLPEPPVGVESGAEAADMRIVQNFDRYIGRYGPHGRPLAGELAVVRAVDGLDRQPRHGVEVGLPPLALLERGLPAVACRRHRVNSTG